MQKSNPCSERSIGEKDIDIAKHQQRGSRNEIPSGAELAESRNPTGSLLPIVEAPVPLYQVNNKDQIISNTRSKNYEKEKSMSTNVHSLAAS